MNLMGIIHNNPKIFDIKRTNEREIYFRDNNDYYIQYEYIKSSIHITSICLTLKMMGASMSTRQHILNDHGSLKNELEAIIVYIYYVYYFKRYLPHMLDSITAYDKFITATYKNTPIYKIINILNQNFPLIKEKILLIADDFRVEKIGVKSDFIGIKINYNLKRNFLNDSFI